MASNFFQRWSSRSLTAKDTVSQALPDTNEVAVESLEPDHVIEPIHDSNSVLDHTDRLSHEVVDDVVAGHADKNEDLDKSSDEALTIDDADSVTFDSGVASFLKQGVDKSVKKAALAKLFHSDEFNYISDMDDHTEDFSNIPKLDESIAKQLRGWVKTVLEEPEQDTALMSETDLAEDLSIEQIEEAEMLAVEDETVEPVTEDFKLSQGCDAPHHKTIQQGET